MLATLDVTADELQMSDTPCHSKGVAIAIYDTRSTYTCHRDRDITP